MRTAFILIAVPLICNCARPDYAEPWSDRLVVAGGPQLGYGVKRVVEKQGPITLLGNDGSVCRTSLRRFADTGVGAWIACNWALPGLDSAEIAGLSR